MRCLSALVVICLLFLGVSAVAAAPSPSTQSTIIMLHHACPTILNSLHRDWQATRQLFQRYGVTAEQNPLIRQIGPDIYFAIYALGVAAVCKETPTWDLVSIIFWVMHTAAVNTHIPLGTYQGPPLLLITILF